MCLIKGCICWWKGILMLVHSCLRRLYTISKTLQWHWSLPQNERMLIQTVSDNLYQIYTKNKSFKVFYLHQLITLYTSTALKPYNQLGTKLKQLLSSGEGTKYHVHCTVVNQNKNITNTKFPHIILYMCFTDSDSLADNTWLHKIMASLHINASKL